MKKSRSRRALDRLTSRLKGRGTSPSQSSLPGSEQPSSTSLLRNRPSGSYLDVPGDDTQSTTGSPSPSPSPSVSETAHQPVRLDAENPTKAGAVEPNSTDVKSPPKVLPNLWTKAEWSLRNDADPEKRDLINGYFEILTKELIGNIRSAPSAPATITDHLEPTKVADILSAKMEDLTNKRLNMSVGSHELNIERLFNDFAKNIISVKDVISSAASSDPHAALACAGGLVLLTFLTRPIEQREQLLEGLELTSSIVERHCKFDPRARISSLPGSTERLEDELDNNLIKLYSKILELQARALIYLHRKRTSQFVRDIFRGDTWKTLVSEITKLDARSREPAQLVTQERLHVFLDQSAARVENQVSEEQRTRRMKLLKLLYTCPCEDRKDINMERAPGTCEWFTSHEYFESWSSRSEAQILWVSADPGCGKSVLAKYLIDIALPGQGQQTVCYFFFKDDFEDQKTAAGAMCSILRQLLRKHPDLMDNALLDRFESDGPSLLSSFRQLFEIFVGLSRTCHQEIVCVLDALDECEEGDRRLLLTELNKLYISRPKELPLKFLLTSRPYRDIQQVFQRLENGLPTIHLRGEDDEQVERISNEINIFIRKRVREISESLLLETEEAQLLEQKLFLTENRTYIWVKLALDVIENILSFTKGNLENALSEIPEGLDRLYEKILNRSRDVKIARKVIHIILAAQRPLTVDEMSIAIAVREEYQTYSQIELEPQGRFVRTLKEICGLFVSVVDGKIYFLHQTAREFLVDDQSSCNTTTDVSRADVMQSGWRQTFSPPESHLVMATICTKYLALYNLADYPDDQQSRLWEYAFNFWNHHCQNIDLPAVQNVMELAIQLCRYPPTDTRPPLIKAVSSGLEPLVHLFLAESTVDSARDGSRDLTKPLFEAADRGYGNIVSILLSNIHEDRDLEPMVLRAIEKGHSDILRSLLIAHKSRNAAGFSDFARGSRILFSLSESMSADFTLFFNHAMEKGSGSVLNTLLDQEPALQGRTRDRWHDLRTLLYEAITRDRGTILQALLQRIGMSDHWVLNFLNSRDTRRLGHLTEMQLTPLMYAASLGHTSLVQTLLDDPRVDPGVTTDLSIGDDCTALHVAVSHHQKSAADCLLRDGRSFVRNQGLWGLLGVAISTANVKVLRAAADEIAQWQFNGFYDEVFIFAVTQIAETKYMPDKQRMLMMRYAYELGGFNPQKRRDTAKESIAIAKQHESTQKSYFLKFLDSGLDYPTSMDELDLLSYARDWNLGMLKSLLQIGKYSLRSTKDDRSRTALHMAVIRDGSSVPIDRDMWNRPLDTVLLLLSYGADPNVRDGEDRTALMYASENGYLRVVKCLIKHDAKVDLQDARGDTAVSLAVRAARSSIVKVLLDAGASAQIKNSDGKAAIDYAKTKQPNEPFEVRQRVAQIWEYFREKFQEDDLDGEDDREPLAEDDPGHEIVPGEGT